jgi:hypothetical protein
MLSSVITAARRALLLIGFAASVSLAILDCGGKVAGTEAGDAGDDVASSGSSGTVGSSSSGTTGTSSGIGGSSSGGNASGSASSSSGIGGSSSSSSGIGGSSTSSGASGSSSGPPPICPPVPPTSGTPCGPDGLMCTGTVVAPGCAMQCVCENNDWACFIPPCPPPPPPPSCLPDGGLLTLDVPDAAIGDSGATLPECYACFESTCPSQLEACNTDCICTKGLFGFLQCVAGGGTTVNCGAMFAGTDPIAQSLTQCVAGPLLGGMGPGCLEPCGAGGGADAGR